MKIISVKYEDGEVLANLRALAMRESLEAIGRYDVSRVRDRFLSTFDPSHTKAIMLEDSLVAFFVVVEHGDHLYLDHLYVHPQYQGKGIGSNVLESVFVRAQNMQKPIRLGALKGSRSNEFYLSHGFIKTHEEEYDIFYEYVGAIGQFSRP